MPCKLDHTVLRNLVILSTQANNYLDVGFAFDATAIHAVDAVTFNCVVVFPTVTPLSLGAHIATIFDSRTQVAN